MRGVRAGQLLGGDPRNSSYSASATFVGSAPHPVTIHVLDHPLVEIRPAPHPERVSPAIDCIPRGDVEGVFAAVNRAS